MKFNVLALIGFFLLFSSTVFSQKRNVYFFKNDGTEVKEKDSADFIRIIQEPGSGEAYFKIYEFYPDNSKRFVGQVSSFDPKLIYEGTTMLYHKKGKKAEQVSYLFGIPVGLAYYYYPNGRVKKEVEYSPEGSITLNTSNKFEKSKLMAYFDSTGTQIVKDGSGSVIITDEDNMLREEGLYSQGSKDGTWKGLYKDAGHHYEEHYKKGVLTSGIQTTSDGRRLNYSKIEEPPQYTISGDLPFQSFMVKNIKLPKDAPSMGMFEKISLYFTIKADGTVADIKAITPFSIAFNQEIMGILKRSGKWIPGKIRGEPIDAKHTFNLGFSRTSIIVQDGIQQQKPSGMQSSRIRRNF